MDLLSILADGRLAVRLRDEYPGPEVRDPRARVFNSRSRQRVFGMVLNGPDADDPDEEWYWNVTVEPGDYMAFYAPWDSGEYDT